MDEKKPVLLITGVSGRLGMNAAGLFSSHFQVVGLDVQFPENVPPYLDCIFTDLSSFENVQDTLEEVRSKYGNTIASCLHFAAYYNFEGGGWDKYQKITVDGTRNLLEALKTFTLEQFIFSSTMLVHAPSLPGQKINEEWPLEPKWEYPLSKVKTEELIKEANFPSVVFRIAGVYDDHCNSIPISQHIMRIYEKQIESHLFPGNPNHGASYLHMDDLMDAIHKAVEKRNELEGVRTYLLGEPVTLSYKTLQKMIGKAIHGKPWWTLRIPKWVAKWGAALKEKLPFAKKSFIKPWMVDLADDHYELDIGKATRELGWQPARELKNCLPKMVEDLQKDPKKWVEKHGL